MEGDYGSKRDGDLRWKVHLMLADRILAWSLAFALAIFPTLSLAQSVTLPGFPPGVFQSRAALDATAAGGCSQATTVNAALDGSQNTSAVTTLICGLVTDGTYSLLNGLYIAATNSIGNFEVNWAAPGTNNLTPHSAGTCTFTANTGITGDATACYFDTGYLGTAFTSTTISVGACVLNSNTTNQNFAALGVSDTANLIEILPRQFGGVVALMGEGNFSTGTSANQQGSLMAVRSSTTNINIYQNGSATANSPIADAFGALPIARTIYLLALNNGGTPGLFSGDKIAYFLFGNSALSAGQVSSIRSRLATYITAVGGSGC